MSLSLTTPEQKWSYADLISSYRFWGIILYFFALSLSTALHTNTLFFERSMLLSEASEQLIKYRSFGVYLGFIPALFACRVKNIYPLYFLGFLHVLSLLLVYTSAESIMFATIGEFLIGLIHGSLLFLIPAYVVSATRSVELLVITLATCTLLRLATFYISLTLLNPPILLPIAFAILSLLVILPAKKQLFHAPPKVRLSSIQEPAYASPAITALLCVIPPYLIFWFIRIHREIRYLKKSPWLMTSRGAGWATVLVPLAIPAISITLNDELIDRLAAEGKETGVRTGWVLFWGLFLPPVATAIIQSKMNRLVKA